MAEDAKHTPGPWTTDYGGDIFGPDGRSLLTSGVEYAGEQDESPWAAIKRAEDAHLITAAPELLAALRIAVDHINHMAVWISAKDQGYSFESLGEDMPGINAAIANATGAPNG